MEAVSKYFSALMSVIYVLVGAGLAWGTGFFRVPSAYALPMGIFLILYGLFRGYRVYQKYFSRS